MKHSLLLLTGLGVSLAVQAQDLKTKDQQAPAGKIFGKELNGQEKFEQLLKYKTDITGRKLDRNDFADHFVLLSFYSLDKDSVRGNQDAMLLYVMQAKIKGLKVVRIAQLPGKYEQAKASWKKSMKEADANLVQLLDNENSLEFSASSAYNVKEYPVAFLLDKNRVIQETFTGSIAASSNAVWRAVDKRLMSGEESKTSDYIAEVKSLNEKFKSLTGAAEKAEILKSVNNSNPYMAEQLDLMRGDLAVHYIRDNELLKGFSLLKEIKNGHLKLQAVYTTATYLLDTRKTELAQGLIEAFMSEELENNKTGEIGKEIVYSFSNLASLYSRLVPVKGNEESFIKYLSPVFATCGFFPLDQHSAATIVSPDSLLTFRYARAISAKGNSSEIINVLASYINADPNRSQLIAAAASYFPDFPGLQQQLTAITPTGNELNKQNLFKLFLKKDLNGKIAGLSSVQSKYILIDFWGSWCGPCRASHPFLKEMYSSYKNKGLEMVGIAAEFGKDHMDNDFVWKRAVRQDDISWIQFLNPENQQYFDAFKAFKDANGAELVQKLILDRDGNFIALFNGKDKDGLQKKLAELMP